MRALTLLLALALLVAPAAADDAGVGVVVVGEVTMQPQLAAQLESWLRKHGHNLVPAPLPPDAINTLVDCFVIEDEVCARKVVEKRSKTQSVVFARVDVKPDAPDKTVALTAYWFGKGRDAIAERRYCERCTDITLRSTADELMAALVVTSAKAVGRVRITSTPAGARVAIDGTPIGVTPVEHELATGSHTITLARDGHREETRAVDVRRDAVAEVDVRMRGTASTRSVLPTVLLGAGGALLATGVVLFVIDEDVPSPVGEQEKYYRDTAPLGVGVAVSGLVVGGIGGYLMFRGKRANAPVASVTPESAYVGWAGTF